MTSRQPPTEGTSAEHGRSGADIAEAIEVAEGGSSVQDLHNRSEDTKSGEAPVEQSARDPEMTEGQVVYGSGGNAGDSSAVPAPTEQSSGVAQSVVGARASDQVAAGEEPDNPAP